MNKEKLKESFIKELFTIKNIHYNLMGFVFLIFVLVMLLVTLILMKEKTFTEPFQIIVVGFILSIYTLYIGLYIIKSEGFFTMGGAIAMCSIFFSEPNWVTAAIIFLIIMSVIKLVIDIDIYYANKYKKLIHRKQ